MVRVKRAQALFRRHQILLSQMKLGKRKLIQLAAASPSQLIVMHVVLGLLSLDMVLPGHHFLELGQPGLRAVCLLGASVVFE